jgi:hypothetical protein
VYDAENPRQAVQNIADRAGLGRLPGRPLTRQQMAVREQHIREMLLAGHDPARFRGRPVEVTPEERRILAGSDQEARRRTASEIARREAQRDSLVAAAGTPERARQLEQAYERASQQERENMAPQMNRELNGARLAHAASIVTTPLVASRINTARRMLLSNQSVRNAAKLFNRVNRQFGSPFNPIQLPRLPRPPRVRPDA